MSRKVLIVIPNCSKFVTAWCYENAFRLIKDGHDVQILDLARFELRYVKKSPYWILDKLLEKNDIRRIVPKDLITLGVKFLNAKTIIRNKTLTNLSLEETSYFNKVMRSVYAWRFGSSLIRAEYINKQLYLREKNNFAKILNNLIVFLNLENFSEIYTVNGRTQIDAIVVFCAQKLKIKYFLIEKTSSNWNYYSVHKKSPQNSSEIFEKIISHYDIIKKEKKIEEMLRIAENFFHPNTNGSELLKWENLQKDPVPNNLDLSNTVVFYPGSDYEFALTDDSNSEEVYLTGSSNTYQSSYCFLDQKTAFDQLHLECKKFDLKLIVRIHPHPIDSHLHETEGLIWAKICSEKEVEFISSRSMVSSIEIAKKSYLNVVFQSSLAAKLIFLEIPTIVMGKTEYTGLVPNLNTKNMSMLQKALESPPRPNKNSIIPWVMYQAYGEYKIEHFELYNENIVKYNFVSVNSKRIFLNKCLAFLSKLKRKQDIFH